MSGKATITYDSTAPMAYEEVRTLVAQMDDDPAACVGQDHAFVSGIPKPGNAHAHICRIGYPGTGTAARVSLAVHDTVQTVQVILTAADARKFAAVLLDLADDVDGTTPLHWAADPRKDA